MRALRRLQLPTAASTLALRLVAPVQPNPWDAAAVSLAVPALCSQSRAAKAAMRGLYQPAEEGMYSKAKLTQAQRDSALADGTNKCAQAEAVVRCPAHHQVATASR